MSALLIVLLLSVVLTAGFALLFNHLLGRAGDRRLRLALPPVLALVVGAVWSFLPSGAGSLVVMVLAISLVAAAGVTAPLSLTDRIVSRSERTLAIVCSSLVSLPLVVALLVNPEGWAGGSAPLLADRIPLFGWIFDPVMGVVQAGTPAFDLAFSLCLWVGFYLEAVLVAAIVYGVFLVVAGRGQGNGA